VFLDGSGPGDCAICGAARPAEAAAATAEAAAATAAFAATPAAPAAAAHDADAAAAAAAGTAMQQEQEQETAPGWACEACTFFNEDVMLDGAPVQNECAICGTGRPASS